MPKPRTFENQDKPDRRSPQWAPRRDLTSRLAGRRSIPSPSLGIKLRPYRLAVSEPAGGLLGVVGEEDGGAGALDAGQDFEDDGLRVEPAFWGGSCRREGLFVSQGDHGINAHGPARRDPAGGERDERYQGDDASKGERICCGHAEEQARQNPGRSQ
jgi:hypothetical protein